MGTMIELPLQTKIQILEMRHNRTMAELDARLVQLAQMIDERNHLIADRERYRQANAELMRRLDALAGYPERLQIGAV